MNGFEKIAGIPGLFPLMLDLPIRFTDSPSAAAAQMGVYKNSRGWLRGWELTEVEIHRLEEIQDAEIVLQQRPPRLHIEVETATKLMPRVDGKAIYSLKVQVKQWSLDKAGNVKVLRYGHPYIHACIHTCMHIHMHTYTHMHACIFPMLALIHASSMRLYTNGGRRWHAARRLQ